MHIINLDGEWSFKLDPDNQGSSEDWFAPTYRLIESEKSIPVPSCWEEFEQDYEGVAWYAKEVEVEASDQGRVCRLIFEASNYRTTVWVNGKSLLPMLKLKKALKVLSRFIFGWELTL